MATVPVSVVIPVLNAESFIAEAIKSVHNQTVAVSEIIVVDNGCVDRTIEIASKLGTKVIKAADFPSISLARNAGFKVSSGDWIALLDGDDRWEPRKIEYQWEAVRACPDAGIVSCHHLVFEKDRVIVENSPEALELIWKGYKGRIRITDVISYFPLVEGDFFPRFQPVPSTVMLRRDVFSTVGLFDEEVAYCEDIEFFMRVFARFSLALIEKTLVQFRHHDRKHSRHFQEMRTNLFAVVNKMLQQREKYAKGAPEAYRDLLKKNFFTGEQNLMDLSRR